MNEKVLSFVLIGLLFFAAIGIADSMREAEELYEKGKREWDIEQLKRGERLLDDKTGKDPYEFFLLKGKLLQRIAYILYVDEDDDPAEKYALKAEWMLGRALKAKPDSPEALWRMGRNYQVLATFGFSNGPKYGKKAAAMTEKLKTKQDARFYYTYLEAMNYLIRPSLFGGDTEKALELFEKITPGHESDVDLMAFYAEALYEEDFYKKGFDIVKRLLKLEPKNRYLKYLEEEFLDELD